MFNLILAALKSVADVVKGWFTWQAGKEKKKKDAVDKVSRGIGRGKPFIILLLLLVAGCGTVYVISTPIAFDTEDFQYLKTGQEFTVPKDGYYFSNESLEVYIRSKIGTYEITKRGYFHKEAHSQ